MLRNRLKKVVSGKFKRYNNKFFNRILSKSPILDEG